MTVEASSPCCCQQITCCQLSSLTMSYTAFNGITEFDLLCSESGGGAIGQGVKMLTTRAFVRASTTPKVLTKFQSQIFCRYTGSARPSNITDSGTDGPRACDGFNTGLAPIPDGTLVLMEAERVGTILGPRWRARGRWIYRTGLVTIYILDVTLTQYSSVDANCPIGLQFDFNPALGSPSRIQGWNGSAQFDFIPSNLSLAGRFVFA